VPFYVSMSRETQNPRPKLSLGLVITCAKRNVGAKHPKHDAHRLPMCGRMLRPYGVLEQCRQLRQQIEREGPGPDET